MARRHHRRGLLDFAAPVARYWPAFAAGGKDRVTVARGAEIPAVGGIGNARAMAEIHAILANGGVARGRRFLSEAGCRRALQQQVDGVDLILGVPMRFGLGFALDTGLMPHPDTLYWGGYGGSLAVIDMDVHIAYQGVTAPRGPR